MSGRILIVSPVRNEAEHLPAVIDAMAAQRRPPDLWLMVDDGSTDATPVILTQAQQRLDFVQPLSAPQAPHERRDRLAVAAEARAFNWALGQADVAAFDFVGKLDGDIVLNPAHFERLLAEFDADPRLGIAGCYLEHDEGGRVQLAQMPAHHVNGALKLYRRECFEEIDGMAERLGWDTIDEIYARMAGWRTHSFRDLRARHLRPSGSAGGPLRGAARHGECAWIVSYPAWLALARGAHLALQAPRLVRGAAYVYGYARAALRRRGRVEDPAFRAFSRAEQRRRLRAALCRARR